MKFRIITFLLSLCVLFNAKAQIKSLAVGDMMPDLKFEMLDYKKPTASLSEFKGKLLILDFWATSCTDCIAKFPELVSIQKKMGDKVMILPIGFDARQEGSIKTFLAKRKNENKPINLPSALQRISDTLLMKLIVFNTIPHEVWIDTTGKIIAITGPNEVNEKNISDYFQGKLEELPLKYWDPKFDRYKPLLVNGNGGADENFVYRSMITNYNPGTELDVRQNDRKFTRLAFGNKPPHVLIKQAAELAYMGDFGDIIGSDHFNKRIRASPSLLHRLTNRGDSTMSQVKRRGYNLFCYDLILPPNFSRVDAGKKMLMDLENFFRINVSRKVEKVNCLALVRVSQKDKMKANSQVKYSATNDDSGIQLTNAPLKHLVNYLNRTRYIPFVLDETGYDLKVDIDLEISTSDDLERIRKALRKYDLDLLPVEKELEMLVLEEK